MIYLVVLIFMFDVPGVNKEFPEIPQSIGVIGKQIVGTYETRKDAEEERDWYIKTLTPPRAIHYFKVEVIEMTQEKWEAYIRGKI